MSTIEVEAKTVEEAIRQACEQLGKPQDQLEIEVISDGSSRMFGIMGGKKARIKAAIKEDVAQDDAVKAKEILENILQRFGADAQVASSEDDECITLNISGDGSGILIGRKGQTLDAFQYLVNKIVHRSPRHMKRIVVDAEGYRQRRRETLIDLAKRLSEKAKNRGAPVSTSPLNPFERRIIHLALQDDAEFTTKSNGEGIFRKVVIFPQKS
ncbi:MAG: RNA-binding cell elongation regulator Jag/EloR [Thermodesulfobacteriota bacterium]|jgi:spoIIIJ-associated protein